MPAKPLKTILRKEIESFFTYLLLKILDLMGWGAFVARIRASILKLFGFKFGKNVKIMTGMTIHKFSDDILIGDNTFINKNVYFDSGNGIINIGKCCDIGFNTVFACSRHELASNYISRRKSEPSKSIVIEDFVWIGCNVILLGGIKVGKGSVVAAGSVVTTDIPPGLLAAGIPARIIKTISRTSLENLE